jgi:cytochrome c oxidase subunit II
MSEWVPFWPNTAAVGAAAVNRLYIAELVLAGIILAAVVGMMGTFCVRYRRGSTASRADLTQKSWLFEIGWTAATLAGFLALFVWGGSMFLWLYRTPPGDIEIFVVGKQWMWQVQYPGGQREIDALHIPAGKTIRLVLASQDVIHSFFVPAFRVKRDAVPGTYETIWFEANRTGTYRLECSEFCGTEHARMKGEVVVMAPAEYGRWLERQGAHQSLAAQGEALFRSYGCSGCHGAGSTVHAPSLAGLYGRLVHLQDGTSVRADQRYIRDSILLPKKEIAAGYPPVMPSYAGQIGEGEMLKLVAYIQSLSRPGAEQ